MSNNNDDLRETAAKFMDSIMSNNRVQEIQEEPKLELDIKSKYDDMTEEELTNGVHESHNNIPEPNQVEMHSTAVAGNVSIDDDQEMLQDRLVSILNRTYQPETVPEPGNETMHSETTQPKMEQTDQHNLDDNESRSNTENFNDHSFPEPGNDNLTAEAVQIVVDRAPNVDQSEYQEFDPEVSANHTQNAPEPTFETEPELDHVDSEPIVSAPEPDDTSFEQTHSAPEPSSHSTISESEPAHFAPEPAPQTPEPVSSAPEPTMNGQQPQMSTEEENETEDVFPMKSIPKRSKFGARSKPNWAIPNQAESGVIDRFGTIRQNIPRGNTLNLLSMWEQKGGK